MENQKWSGFWGALASGIALIAVAGVGYCAVSKHEKGLADRGADREDTRLEVDLVTAYLALPQDHSFQRKEFLDFIEARLSPKDKPLGIWIKNQKVHVDPAVKKKKVAIKALKKNMEGSKDTLTAARSKRDAVDTEFAAIGKKLSGQRKKLSALEGEGASQQKLREVRLAIGNLEEKHSVVFAVKSAAETAVASSELEMLVLDEKLRAIYDPTRDTGFTSWAIIERMVPAKSND